MTSTPWGGSVFHHQSTSSTMEDAQDLEDRGEPDGSLAWADVQTSGRGRHPGRTWVGTPGQSLLFTVFWRPNRFRVPGFAPSLVVGLGVCLWMESMGLAAGFPVALKWPNDVYLAGRKTAGILVRRRLGPSGTGSIHGGIGINLAPPPLDQGFRTSPGSLADAGISMTPAEALKTLLPHLAAALDHPDPRGACEQRLWKLGSSLDLTLPDGQVSRTGVVIGLDPSGSLVWEGPGGREVITSAE